MTIGGMLSFSGGTLNVGDAELAAIAGLTSAADKCFYFTGSGTAATFDCPSWARSVISAANASAGRTAFGLAIGSDVQAYDAELAALAGLTSANNKCFYWTGAGTAATFDCSSYGRGLINAADASAARTSLGAVIGTDVQAYNARLAAIAGYAATANRFFGSDGSGNATLITLPAAGLVLSGGALSLANDLAALEGLSSTGFATRTTTDTWAQRTMTGTTNEVCVTNGDGVSGNPTFGICSGFLSTAHSWSGQQTFTNPIVGTQSPGDNSTKGASTAYADAIAALKANVANGVHTGLTDFQGATKRTGISSPSQITSNQNDYNPGSVICATADTLILSSDASREVTGLAGGVSGCEVLLVNSGSNPIVLKDSAAGSTAGNRFSTGADISLAASQAARFIYQAGSTNKWRYIGVPSSGGGGGSGTVTSVACDGNGVECSTITSSGTVRGNYPHPFLLSGM